MPPYPNHKHRTWPGRSAVNDYQPPATTVDQMQPEHVRARRADQIAKLTEDIKRYEEYIAEAKAKLKFWQQVPA